MSFRHGVTLSPSPAPEASMQSRRSLLTRLAAAAAAFSLPRSLFARPPIPFRAGDPLALGWSIEKLNAKKVTLRHDDGRRAEIEIRPRGATPIGIAQNATHDFILINDGHGRKPTDEDLGRVILGMARHG
jgi:hypothetical protein